MKLIFSLTLMGTMGIGSSCSTHFSLLYQSLFLQHFLTCLFVFMFCLKGCRCSGMDAPRWSIENKICNSSSYVRILVSICPILSCSEVKVRYRMKYWAPWRTCLLLSGLMVRWHLLHCLWLHLLTASSTSNSWWGKVNQKLWSTFLAWVSKKI